MWIRPASARQARFRSQEMVERILGSAQRLMKEAGFKGLTTIAIAEQAGLADQSASGS